MINRTKGLINLFFAKIKFSETLIFFLGFGFILRRIDKPDNLEATTNYCSNYFRPFLFTTLKKTKDLRTVLNELLIL
jgi:hypothetical protein